MPSPFPGMDPYLENPGLWPDVHHRIITASSDLLMEQIRPKYYVRVEQRVYVSDEDDPGRRVIALIEDEIHEARLEVIDRERREVVTVIEVVSPTNKVGGSRGRGSYLKKRAEVLDSPSHWVEIDLLRNGEPLLPVSQFRPCEYRVCLSRANKRPDATVWPIRLTQRLPVITIPLRGDDPDAKLDLQAVLSTVYDRAAYDLEINYSAEPVPPLPPELAAWANEWLRAKGAR